MDRLRRSSDRSQAGRLLAPIAFALSLTVTPALAFTPSGLLEIHQINIQQGDCTLIIGPDGTRILIDAGNNGKGTNKVVPYMQSLGIMPSDGLQYMIATHHDADHVGGLDDVIYAGYDVLNNVWDNGSTYTTQTVTDFLNAAATTTAGPVTQMPLGTVIPLGDGATARCVAVNGDVLGFGSVSGATANENDMSIAILVQYKDFDYITAGDLGGGEWTADNNCTGRTTGQVNVESPLATSLLPGGGAALLTTDGIEVLDVNHHGSESSTNSEWMNMLTPSVALINVGAGQGSNYHHPRKDVVENVLQAGGACISAPPALVLQTEEGSPVGTNTSFAGFCSGDLIVKTTGLGTYQVSGTGDVSQGPDERVAAGIEPPADFPIDGGGSGDTEAPVATVLAPNGSESWDANTSHDITWTATDNVGVTSIDLSYSTTGGGGPFTTIALGEANDGIYSWNVPDNASSDAYVRVVAHDAAGNTGSDVSDAAFTINGSGQPQALVINEIMQNPASVGDTRGEWFELYNPGAQAVDINGWTIRDDGGDSHVIANGGPLNVPAGGYLVLGRNGNTNINGGYVADYVYSGLALANSADEVILVDGQGAIVDRVDYTGVSPWPAPNGASMALTDPGLDNNVATNWTESTARGGTYDGSGSDLGTPGAANSVGPDTEDPVVVVQSPNGAENWVVGSQHDITWNATDNVGVTSIDIAYSTTGAGGSFTNIATGEANDGVYAWTVPNDPSTNVFIKVVAHDAAANTGEDVSDGAMTISTPPPVLVLNEIMANPLSVGDTEGEWFEIYNPGVSAVDIDGWTIRDDGSDSHVIANGGPLDVPAGGYLVLGRNGDPGVNGGYTADYVYSNFLLANAADEIYLVDDQGMTIDAVLYTNTSPWPNPDGASIELSDPGLDNADGANWALAAVRGGTFDGSGSDLGTPGAANGGGATAQLHVHGLTVDNVPANGGRWSGLATITVHDQNHNPASGVTVVGDWSGNTSETGVSGVTNGSGVATIESKKVKNPSSTFCFDVTDLSASGYAYDAASDAPQTPPAVCGSGIQAIAQLPVAFDLRVIDGNPVRSRTSFKFSVPMRSRIELSLFDVQGRRVAKLVDGVYPGGHHIQQWYGRDDQGRPVPSGVYLVMMNNGQGLRLVQRLAVVR